MEINLYTRNYSQVCDVHSIVPDLDCLDGDDNACDCTEWQRFIQKTTKGEMELWYISVPQHVK